MLTPCMQLNEQFALPYTKKKPPTTFFPVDAGTGGAIIAPLTFSLIKPTLAWVFHPGTYVAMVI